MGQNILRIFIYTLISPLFSKAYKLPSPPEVCASMIPLHLKNTTVSPQSSESPFTLKVSHTHIRSGATFNITIKTNVSDVTFQGFMIQVRNFNTSKPFGQFLRTPEAKWLYCWPGEKNVLANYNNKEKTIFKTTWACPPKFKGLVYAMATVMRDEKEYWVGHKSHIVNISELAVKHREYDEN